MSALLVGAIAGGTLLLGLPMGRWAWRKTARAMVPGVAMGILIFLGLDLIGHARELPLAMVAAWRAGSGGGLLLALVLAGSLAALIIGWRAGGWLRARPLEGGRALRAALLVAVALGAYNFLQGMSFGQAGRFTAHSAVSESGGAVLLVVGLLLHNLGKSVALVGPLVGMGRPVPWSTLLALGAIAGLPTVVGSALGALFWNPYLFVTFFAGAAGLVAAALVELGGEVGRVEQAHAYGGLIAGIILAAFVTFALEISHYSLPELLPSYWL